MTIPAPYARILFRGHRFDNMTKAAIEHAEHIAELLYGGTGPADIWQGSYNPAKVAQSGGTHDEGGAKDSGRIPGLSWEESEFCWRLAGFADWHRLPFEGDWDEHDHGILIGHGHVSPSANNQRIYYRMGQNGLRSHLRDTSRRPDPIVPFRYPLGVVDLSNVRKESEKSKGWVARTGVRHMQRALNLKLDAGLKVDGIYGPLTRNVYKRWELNHNGDGDGLPTVRGATLLGAARFTLHA